MVIDEIIAKVKKNMLGRIADEKNNTRNMAETVLRDGDHLEIGTLHGGSAIVAAMVKREYGYKGTVTCVDPLSGYYMDFDFGKETDPISKVPVSLATLRENMKRFDVDLEIIQTRSSPFPVKNRTFTTAYIDGVHIGEMPLTDFKNCAEVVTDFITFDNYSDRWGDVKKACEYAETVWRPFSKNGITCIVRHP